MSETISYWMMMMVMVGKVGTSKFRNSVEKGKFCQLSDQLASFVNALACKTDVNLLVRNGIHGVNSKDSS
jgi:hypothetical protein